MSYPSTSIFERTSALARELGAINLGQGFPDLPEPGELLEAARRALVEKSNQYPPMRGLPELRRAVCDYYRQEQGLQVREEEVIVTSGATEALAAAILAFVRPGDEAIVFQPFYDAYLPLVERAGGTVRTVSLAPPRWSVPLDRLEAAIGPRTRLVILNTPNNPTGTVVDRATLEAIGALCERHGLILLCDEVWEAMIYGPESLGAEHVSPLAVASLRERAVKVGSAGKIFSLTGWKVGWAVAAPPLAEAIARQHQFLTFTTPTPLQWAVAQGLALPADWHAEHRARYQAARGRLVSGLEAAGYVLLPADGTWFVTVDLAASGLPADDEAVAERLIREAGVAAIPVSAFYRDAPEKGYLRLCFAKEDATLDEAIGRLAGFRGRQ
jgi:aspartate/methionine/tyrosine aminotransferase